MLVVDDNRHMRHLIKGILGALGIRKVAEAEDGKTAMEELQNFDADIVVCDWNMEPMDGLEFTRNLRNSDDSPNIYIPVIMLTGHTDISRVTIARDAGVNEYLAKPVSAKKLYQRIHSIIDAPRDFIRATNYFGPDRRRRRDPNYTGGERRKQVHH